MMGGSHVTLAILLCNHLVISFDFTSCHVTCSLLSPIAGLNTASFILDKVQALHIDPVGMCEKCP